MRHRFAVVSFCIFTWIITTPVHAQELTIRCFERPTDLTEPWTSREVPCIEEVVNDPSLGELGFTSLAVSPDNVLYASRPLAGQIIELTDTDNDGLPETPRILVDGLTLPTSLAWFDGILYAAGSTDVHRIIQGTAEKVVGDLPVGGGFWTGGIAVGILENESEPRIYVATGGCDECTRDEAIGRGTIFSFALDGSDRRVVADGFRQPADMTIHDGRLYVVDSAPNAHFDIPDLDEVNQVEQGGEYGHPTCYGVNYALESGGCDDSQPPIFTLPTGSNPLGLAFYDSDVIPAFADNWLMVLGGTHTNLTLRGYQIVALAPNDSQVRTLVPATSSPEDPRFAGITPEQLNYRTTGLFPHRPMDIVVNDWGWVYISIGGGRILAFRPQVELPA